MRVLSLLALPALAAAFTMPLPSSQRVRSSYTIELMSRRACRRLDRLWCRWSSPAVTGYRTPTPHPQPID